MGGIWSFSYSDFLNTKGTHHLTLYSSSGRLHRFAPNADKTLYRDINNPGLLMTFDAAVEQWLVNTPEQLTYSFSTFGHLTKITNAAGLSHTIERNNSGGITRVIHSLGGSIEFTRSFQQSVVPDAVITSEGVTIEYDYRDTVTKNINN